MVISERVQFTVEQMESSFEDAMFLTQIANGIVLNVHFSADFSLETKNLTFQFSSDYLQSFGLELFEAPFGKKKELCCTSQMIIHEIVNTQFSGAFKNVLIESKALELLLCYIKSCSDQLKACESCKFLKNPDERQKISQAREFLLDNLQNPPTIPILAKKVGINECYLKKGFKDLYQTTISGFIQEQRIQKAKLLLSTTQRSITEIAEEVGFSNSSNFTNAFKNYTGVIPSSIRLV